VDIIRSNSGLLVLEVNSSPGLKGIGTSTQRDIAGQIVQFIKKSPRPPYRTRMRGMG
jgi:ribosomal protein S6--L-glutamate ligase